MSPSYVNPYWEIKCSSSCNLEEKHFWSPTSINSFSLLQSLTILLVTFSITKKSSRNLSRGSWEIAAFLYNALESDGFVTTSFSIRGYFLRCPPLNPPSILNLISICLVVGESCGAIVALVPISRFIPYRQHSSFKKASALGLASLSAPTLDSACTFLTVTVEYPLSTITPPFSTVVGERLFRSNSTINSLTVL